MMLFFPPMHKLSKFTSFRSLLLVLIFLRDSSYLVAGSSWPLRPTVILGSHCLRKNVRPQHQSLTHSLSCTRIISSLFAPLSEALRAEGTGEPVGLWTTSLKGHCGFLEGPPARVTLALGNELPTSPPPKLFHPGSTVAWETKPIPCWKKIPGCLRIVDKIIRTYQILNVIMHQSVLSTLHTYRSPLRRVLLLSPFY